MSFSKIIAGFFGIVFIVILYVIIYYALKTINLGFILGTPNKITQQLVAELI